ncbi:helix-turn-helix domain-containing protein [Streptomyces canus]|uniref:helix-turn-helix domain-containing protein n=1 Tax=Streptomyces canus TaxID=58343 RepID=UPI003AF4068D
MVPSVVKETAPSAPCRYLREADRIHVADRLREKAGVRAIAAELGRSPSAGRRRGRKRHIPTFRGISHVKAVLALHDRVPWRSRR